MKLLLILLLHLSTLLAYSQVDNVASKDSIQVIEIWEEFGQAFNDGDIEKMKMLSLKVVYCSECATNTETESDRFYSQFDRVDFNEDSLNHAYYINNDEFFNEDYPLIRSYSIDRINSKVIIINDEINKSLYTAGIEEQSSIPPMNCYSILLQVAPPDEKYDGMQSVFSFVKTEDGYRFCAYGTIP